MNYDANHDELVGVRAEAGVEGRSRVLAALVRVDESPPPSGVSPCAAALDGCLTGALAATSTAPAINSLITGGKLVQATSPTAASTASIAQFKQQAIASSTYVASTNGSQTSSSPPACTIPAGANADTVVYIEQVSPGTMHLGLPARHRRRLHAQRAAEHARPPSPTTVPPGTAGGSRLGTARR